VRTDTGASPRQARPVPLRRPPGRAAGGPAAS